eukprot:714711-Prymnesium_polylepis.1
MASYPRSSQTEVLQHRPSRVLRRVVLAALRRAFVHHRHTVPALLLRALLGLLRLRRSAALRLVAEE